MQGDKEDGNRAWDHYRIRARKKGGTKMYLWFNMLMYRLFGGLAAFKDDDSGVGVVEIILILVGICIADKSRILCGNFRCI